MQKYQILGQTRGKRKVLPYQTITYAEKMLAGIELAEVEQYNWGLGLILKWLQTAISTRKSEITRRKILAKKAREERANCIQQEEDRKQRRAEYLTDQKIQWEADNAWAPITILLTA